jgi:hypothetical protein
MYCWEFFFGEAIQAPPRETYSLAGWAALPAARPAILGSAR